MIKLIECPRDAMQGIEQFIPTAKKAAYINQLLQVGFDTIDFGSFVSPKAIPQLRDTEEVLAQLNLSETNTKLLAIVANLRGAKQASTFSEVSYIGFPFSISETFQLRNTNSTIEKSFNLIQEIQNLAQRHNKKMVVYISMAFGNPYGDEWNAEIVMHWINLLVQKEVKIFALSDTIGVSSPESIEYLFEMIIPAFPKLEIGAHFHTVPDKWEEKFTAALNAGCKRFDGAINGLGGCPMAKDELTGNMATENMIDYLIQEKIALNLDQKAMQQSILMASDLFALH